MIEKGNMFSPTNILDDIINYNFKMDGHVYLKNGIIASSYTIWRNSYYYWDIYFLCWHNINIVKRSEIVILQKNTASININGKLIFII